MQPTKVVSEAEWMEASRALLAEEKAWTRERDRLAEKRRALPWVKVEKDYVFEGAEGPVSLTDLFKGRGQLHLYHFMFAPDWEEGCVGCSFLCDHIERARPHFEQKDIAFVAVSRAPLDKLLAYRARMGWTFDWVSSARNDFNADFNVSFPGEARKDGVFYNFGPIPDPGIDDLPGTTIFAKGDDGAVYRTYSSYGRGGEVYLSAYAVMDMTPKGRDEGPGGTLSHWVKRHDRYGKDGDAGCHG